MRAERIPVARQAYAGKVAIRHIIEAARAAGLDPAGIEALPDGTIRVVEARALPKSTNLFDELEQSGKL
jgi:hypothetical protein